MLHIKYQGSKPSGSRQEYFYVFIMLFDVNSDLLDEAILTTEPQFERTR